MEKVRIFNEYEGGIRTRCFVGENELHNVTEIDFNVSVDKIPEFIFCVNGIPDMELYGETMIKFHPETVQDACKVLQRAYRVDRVFRDAFLASCQSAIGDIAGDCGHEVAAKYLADCIMGVG